jgi:uncharacterized protein (DUF433 family)
MPESKDLLEQFLKLPPDRRETFVAQFFEASPFLFRPLSLLKHRGPDFPSVLRTPNVCGGSPRLVRTRIPVWLLQQMRQNGFSEAQILESYPTLTAGDLVQAWGYAAAHKAEIEKEIEDNERH